MTDEAAVRRVVLELAAGRGDQVDQITLARVTRSRTEALRRLEESRDIASWQATVARLDAEEAAARAPSTNHQVLSEFEIRSYLANIGELWRNADDTNRQGIALALFDRITATGFRELGYQWSASALAHGLDRIVPATIEVDLARLGLRGAPCGTASLRLLDSGGGAATLEAAG